MKRKDEICLSIEAVEYPNRGFGMFEGELVEVSGVIPGQTVCCRLSKKRKGHWLGHLISVRQKAVYEQEPACPHFDSCGGCTYQHISYEKELTFKRQMVEKVLGLSLDEMIGAQGQRAYRNKMEYSFGDTGLGGDLSLGLRKRKSMYEVVFTEYCSLVDHDFLAILKSTLETFQASNADFYHKGRHEGFLRYLVVRKGMRTGEILVHLITSSQQLMDLAVWQSSLKNLPLEGEITGILHSVHDGLGDVVRSDSMEILYGRAYFYEKLCGLQFQISPYSFFQTNTIEAEKLYNFVLSLAGDLSDQTVFDLYCGTGTIAQVLAKKAKIVFGIDIVAEAVKAAEENAEMNGIKNCKFIAGDVLKMVDTLNEAPDLIILDPPREGLHPKAIEKIIDFSAPRIIYISCKVTSLARDLPVFLNHNYQVCKVASLDMFPRTTHVETVVLLSKLK